MVEQVFAQSTVTPLYADGLALLPNQGKIPKAAASLYKSVS